MRRQAAAARGPGPRNSFLVENTLKWPLAAATSDESDASYVRAHDGSVLSRALVYRNLVEHMRRWASIAGRHGLLLLEVHSLSVAATAAYRAEATSLHFDALQSWSGQLLVPAAQWQLALAHAGLLPDADLLCYPKDAPYTRITLQRLVPVPAPCAGLRLATRADLQQLGDSRIALLN